MTAGIKLPKQANGQRGKMSNLSPLEFASFYSEHGWEIFPCKPKDKTPLVKWADVATTDMFQIAEWWSMYPDATIGMATGKRSGFFALDVYAGHNAF